MVTVDPENPTSIFTASNISINGTYTGYTPLSSSSAVQDDIFRYQSGMLSVAGYYFNDKLCVNGTTLGSSFCW